MTKSVNEKIWQQKYFDEHHASELRRQYGLSDLLARILATRIEKDADANDFLIPKIKNLLPNPFHLLDIDKAILRTAEALQKKQKICIFADYDVDGATSSALLKNIFRDLRNQADIYVPDRIAEGYGPTEIAMQRIKDAGASLVITVDCGSMAHAALKFARALGLEVIVIDHHLTAENLPEAVAVVNPNRLDETSEYTYLAAVGVAFLFAAGLVSHLKENNYFAEGLGVPNLMQYLDLVALGTVCDVMPIIALNRAFVAQGLKIMTKRQNIGLKALCDSAAFTEKPNCYHLGFLLGPRINAGGRVGRSTLGANLLTTNCENEASLIAAELEAHNNERKVIEMVMLEEAMELAQLQANNHCIFVAKEGWHPGVIGIIAGRLKEKYNKPTAVIALNEGVGKASCRSIKGIDFGVRILQAKEQDLVVVGGGHAMAAGFTVKQGKLEDLQAFLENMFAQDFKNLKNYGVEEYVCELTTSSLGPDLLQELSLLEPYGVGNSEPIFKISNLFVLKADIVGGKHIKCMLAPNSDAHGSKPINAIAFGSVGTNMEKILLSRKPLNIAAIGTIKSNVWQDRVSVQFQIRDLIV